MKKSSKISLQILNKNYININITPKEAIKFMGVKDADPEELTYQLRDMLKSQIFMERFIKKFKKRVGPSKYWTPINLVTSINVIEDS